ncbi:MAG: vWA domain-containing protein [Pseudomonadota bacterium]
MTIRLWIAVTLLVLTNITSHVSAEDIEQAAQPVTSGSHPADSLEQHQAQDTINADINKTQMNAELDSKPLQNLPSDVRVLVDISGSMKKTDPQNLRKPALDLIVRLLPDKSRAGIWTFGQSVNLLMPHRLVDGDWRKQAALKANEINSIAFFTNIGKALEEVTHDQKNLGKDFKTHIILLTDGVVDISKEAVENAKERQRILAEMLPDLKSAGYIIHTIALSADADADLLKKISVATDGVFVTAHSADELTSTFLKIFDQAVPAERIPLENNGFLVDVSVKEFTALIFRKPGVEKTIIVAPNGKEYAATNPQAGINWYRTDKYDLITADTPEPGEWKIKTEITPQSRITVVSNLQLMMQPLKNNIHSNDRLALHYSFQENNKAVTNIDFLSLLQTNVIVVKDGAKENTMLSLDMPEPPADGIYHQYLVSFAETGDYEVHIYVDGKTFKREYKHSLSVRDSLLTLDASDTTAEDGRVTYLFKIATETKLVNLAKTKMTVAVKSSKNNNSNQELNLIDNNHWQFSFSPEQTADYYLSFHALGEMLDGEMFDETINAAPLAYEEKAIAPKPAEPAPLKTVVAPLVEKKPEKIASAGNNKILYIGIAIANILVGLFGYLVYRIFFSGKAKDEIAEIEKTLSMDGKVSEAKTPKSPEKLKIDLNEEKPANIPISDTLGMDTLFPLDDMGDEKK